MRLQQTEQRAERVEDEVKEVTEKIDAGFGYHLQQESLTNIKPYIFICTSIMSNRKTAGDKITEDNFL